jgi:hypothetical protein
MNCGTIQLGIDVNAKVVEPDIKAIAKTVKNGAVALKAMGPDKVIGRLDDLGKVLLRSDIKSMEGVPFLAMWLRKANLHKLLEETFGDPRILTEFMGTGRRKVKAQPRGLACHWIAGNVPTLGFFSLFQSMMVGNANILRIPAASVDVIQGVLEVMARSEASELMGSFSVITFPSSNQPLNESLSMEADVRVVWGGMEAVNAITNLPTQSHCEDVVFGPKYSFAVMDRKALGSPKLQMLLRRLVNDIVIFDQEACSSPQVLFIEKGGRLGCKELMGLIGKEFEAVSKRSPKTGTTSSVATRILTKRAEYALSKKKDLLASKDTGWTILYDEKLALEEPVQHRTIFLKPVDRVLDVLPLITNKVQTIGYEIHDRKTALQFADGATSAGVSRCVPFGQMNLYDNPWDGMLVMSRLVRFCSMFTEED